MEDQKQCPFFYICASYIIRDMRGENWSERFCFGDFKSCCHFPFRDIIRVLITRSGYKETLCTFIPWSKKFHT